MVVRDIWRHALVLACIAAAPTWARAALEETASTAAWTAPAAGLATAAETATQALGLQSEGIDGLLTPELGVWLVVRHAAALRDGHAFDVLDANLATLALLPSEPPAAVPLPASAWLFVTGLLGLVGSRLSRRRPGAAAVLPPAHAATA